MERRVEQEILDELPAADKRAARSRRDLKRLNDWMGSATIMTRALRSVAGRRVPRKLVDLGTGDGTFVLQVARLLGSEWRGMNAVLIDRQIAIRRKTLEDLATLGWETEVLTMDVIAGLRRAAVAPGEVYIANLFLHHWPEVRLLELIAEVAHRAEAFVAVEPRRSAWSLVFSRSLWCIGCGPVTRHDAPVSVRAGFSGCELSRLWPSQGNWSIEERAAGWFSHLFVARRQS